MMRFSAVTALLKCPSISSRIRTFIFALKCAVKQKMIWQDCANAQVYTPEPSLFTCTLSPLFSAILAYTHVGPYTLFLEWKVS